MTERLLTAEELAEFLGVSVATLYQWRWKNTGPPALKVGRYLRWRQADVDAWLDERQEGHMTLSEVKWDRSGWFVNVDEQRNVKVLHMSKARLGLRIVTLLMQAVTLPSAKATERLKEDEAAITALTPPEI